MSIGHAATAHNEIQKTLKKKTKFVPEIAPIIPYYSRNVSTYRWITARPRWTQVTGPKRSVFTPAPNPLHEMRNSSLGKLDNEHKETQRHAEQLKMSYNRRKDEMQIKNDNKATQNNHTDTAEERHMKLTKRIQTSMWKSKTNDIQIQNKTK